METVRIVYRVACRAANRLITESRRAFYECRVKESSHDPRALWRCVKGLLHTNKPSTNQENGMCDRFSAFFNEKITKAKVKVALLRSQLSQKPQSESCKSELLLDVFEKTSVSEVSKLIAQLPNKTSPLDYIHTSLL